MLKIANDIIYNLPLDKKHRFPMLKYKLLPELLKKEGTCTNDNFFCPSDIVDDDILLTHDELYFNNLLNFKLNKKELRAIGFPMSKLLIDREKKIVQGTLESALFALKYKVSLNIAGGTHHAFSDRAEAFCILNDQSIAANYLIHKNLCQKILILDLDVHQGNGTAEIFRNKTISSNNY